MLLRKTALVYFSFWLFLFSTHAQPAALSLIDTADLKEYISFLASDDLQGRALGTEVDGLEITANYLARYAKELGLSPGAAEYFQPVPVVHSWISNDAVVEVKNEKGRSLLKSDDLVKIYNSSGVFSLNNEPVTFIGFGENIESQELEDKVVLVAQGDADSFERNDFLWDSRQESKKINAILEKNPKALLTITSPMDKQKEVFKLFDKGEDHSEYRLKGKEIVSQPAIFIGTPKVADILLGSKGAYEKYLTAILAGGEESRESTAKLSLNVGVKPEVIETKNVVAYIEGTDPVLKDEYIVFIAHYDHLGISKDGDVYNGADDNASGVAAIMEVAEAFASLDKQPKRSIVFLWVTLEELGHYGSGYYCENPIFPLEKTVAAINLDMVGRVYDGPRDDVWKDSPKKVKDFDGLYTLSNDVWPQLEEINAHKCADLGLVPDTSLPKERFMRASDHYYFHKNGVPILNYATGYHADYHKVGDEADRINFEKVKRVADLCFLVANELANMEEIEF
ncbi:MAG TPA: M20/M25/M40 family metallo-hydrolase [Draconibacterium sp.]|nr:M20/M25/M40 family metallo-hydrolase [Draconibacterium sp.]